MLALAGQPSHHGLHACMVHWAQECTLEKLQAKTTVRPLFLLVWVFLFGRNSRVRHLGGLILWYLWWEGSALLSIFGLEVFI